jgi:hypothetical protein
VRFASFLSGVLTAMAVINQPERKLVKRTSGHCYELCTFETGDQSKLFCKKKIIGQHWPGCLIDFFFHFMLDPFK